MNLSPLTVPYRGIQRSLSVALLVFFGARAAASRLPGGQAAVIGLAALAVVAVVAYELAYYRRFEYELTDDSLDIRSGVFGRRERELPYRRIQNVDVTRNAIQRVLGIAAVGFETAGGSQTEGSIRFVAIEEAERLQREIRRRKRGTAEEAEEVIEELYAISDRELGLVGALSFDARVVGILTILGPGSIPFLSGILEDPVGLFLAMGWLLVTIFLVAAWVLGIVVAVVNYAGFRLTRTEDELRYERGLLRRYTGSIPLSKVQMVVVNDNPVKRAFGFATLAVETAGYSPGRGSDRTSQVAVPIAARERVFELAEELDAFGTPSLRRPPSRVRRRYLLRYLLATVALVAVAYAADWYVAFDLPWYGVAVLGAIAPVAAHLKWRHRGYWLGPDHVVTRNGFWNRSITVVPYYRIQTVIESRSIFQRRWGLATVIIDTAVTVSLVGHTAAAVDIEIEDAIELRESLGQRLREAVADRRRQARWFGTAGAI